MKSTKISEITKQAVDAVKRYRPEILMGIGITGMLTTTVMAVGATPKALSIIQENSGIDHDGYGYSPSAKETIQLCWKCYIPAALVGVASAACLIFSCSENSRRNAALATAYSVSESALKEYQAKVVETIGEKKEKIVRDEIAKDRLDKTPLVDQRVIITEKGNTLCFDPRSGRYFKSDIDKIKKAENEIGRRMLDERYVSLNDFYYEIGLDNVQGGDDLGWNVVTGLIEIGFSSQLTKEDVPCLVLDYKIAPKYEYQMY